MGSQSLNLRDPQFRGAGVYISGSGCGKRTSVLGCIEISCVFSFTEHFGNFLSKLH